MIDFVSGTVHEVPAHCMPLLCLESQFYGILEAPVGLVSFKFVGSESLFSIFYWQLIIELTDFNIFSGNILYE